MATIELLAQTIAVGLLAGWLVLGVLENLRAPDVNRDVIASILSLDQLRRDQPQIYQAVRRNRIAHERAPHLLFRLIVAAEFTVAALLVAGTVSLVLALAGTASVETARAVAALGALGFTAIWGCFLVGGQWFHYWASHEGAQLTHFVMTIWGLVTLLLLF
ncbi:MULTISPECIES: DUF2165 family protein [unclassified Roseitalea]|uniref:DUF2165 family protein n=1 Tax=unclassified Roseitalea TaxID=2639107 RepID=UPI00273E1030|nr:MULTISPECIES: DUF2165 family protein [unclassified Roseitalea]